MTVVFLIAPSGFLLWALPCLSMGPCLTVVFLTFIVLAHGGYFFPSFPGVPMVIGLSWAPLVARTSVLPSGAAGRRWRCGGETSWAGGTKHR